MVMLVSVAEIIIVVIVAIMAKPTIGKIILIIYTQYEPCLHIISMYSNKFNVRGHICIKMGRQG